MRENPGSWIETAVRPLADNADLQQAAASLLEEAATGGALSMRAQAKGTPMIRPRLDGPDAAVARWDALDAGKRRPWVKWACLAVLAVVSAWAWAGTLNEGLGYWRIYRMFQQIFSMSLSDGKSTLEEGFMRQLNDRGRLLLFGDITKDTRSDRMKGLWDSAPGDPAYFMEYAGAYLSDHSYQLPPDFLETARRLDPDNSWFTYYAAAANLREAVEADRQGKAARDAGAAKTWTIRDPQKLDESIALLHQACGQPRFDSYQTRLIRERIPFIPQAEMAEYLVASCAAVGPMPELSLQLLGKGIAARAWQCGEQGDREGFLRLLADAEMLATQWAGSETGNIIGELVLVSCLSTALPNLHATAEKFGLTGQARQLKLIDERLKQRKTEVKARQHAQASERVEARASVLASFSLLTYVKSPPPITDDELKPGRLADHEVLSRACCLAIWLTFGGGGWACWRSISSGCRGW